jgi:hypothetical protein
MKKMTSGMILCSLEKHLEVFYHLIDILRHLIKVRIKDAFALIPGLEVVELRQLLILRFLLLDLLHIKVCLAEIYTGFSDGNNKKEKVK